MSQKNGTDLIIAFYTALNAAGATDWDIMGLSYYPHYGAGNTTDLTDLARVLAAFPGKPIGKSGLASLYIGQSLYKYLLMYWLVRACVRTCVLLINSLRKQCTRRLPPLDARFLKSLVYAHHTPSPLDMFSFGRNKSRLHGDDAYRVRVPLHPNWAGNMTFIAVC